MEQLDKIDLKILQALDKDVRTPLKQIAAAARISKERAHYRLQRLEENKIITGYWAVPKIGRETAVYKIFLKDKSLGNKRKELISYLVNNPSASWIAETKGSWDFIISAYTSAEYHFVKFTRELLARYGKYFAKKAIIKAQKMYSINEKYLHREFVRVVVDDFVTETPDNDKVNQLIIKELSSNARANYTEVAKAIGLSGEATRLRLKKLLNDGSIIDTKIRINHSALGLSYHHVMLSVQDYRVMEAIHKYYSEHPNCVFIMNHLGEYDVHLEIVIEDQKLPKFIEELSEKFGEILSGYDVLQIVKEHKMIIMR